MMKRIYFTKAGFEKFRLETVAIENRLKEAQSRMQSEAELGGDLWHDNSAYDQLVIDIRGLDRSLSLNRQILDLAAIVEPPTHFTRVAMGLSARILRDGTETNYSIVGYGESDPDRNALAYNTPLAMLFIGKVVGEVVKGQIGGKETTIEILEISKGGTEDVPSP